MLKSLCTMALKNLISIVSCVMLLTFKLSVSSSILEVVTVTIAVALTVTLAMTLAVMKAVMIVTVTSKQAMKSGLPLKITALETTPGTSRIYFYLISRISVSRVN